MPPLRPPSDSDSGSDSDAPEAISLSQSKKSIKQQNSEIQKAGAVARQKIKLKNREKDQRLKERALLNQMDDEVSPRGRKNRKQAALNESADDNDGENEDDEKLVDNDVEARMLRAMRDAENESKREGNGSEDDEDEALSEFKEGSSFGDDPTVDEDGDNNENISKHGFGSDEDEDMGHDEMGSDDDDAASPKQPMKSANYLPDEVFKAAFSQAMKPKSSQPKKKAVLSEKQQKKRRRSGPKDVIVGSKAIRTLATTTKPVSATAAVPSSKINRFLDRTLALKGQKPVPGKGWERKPANIGVLRRNGPPAHFVRKQ